MYRSIDTPSEGGECHTVRYETREEKFTRAIVFDLFGKKGVQTHRTRNGKLYQGEDLDGNLNITFGNALHNTAIPFKIIDTDYEKYSIEYQCDISLGFQRVEYIWIMTRVPIETDSELFQKIEKEVKEKMVKLFNTAQSGNEKYSDFKNYFEAPDQGDDFCDYETVLKGKYHPQSFSTISHNHLSPANDKKEEESE